MTPAPSIEAALTTIAEGGVGSTAQLPNGGVIQLDAAHGDTMLVALLRGVGGDCLDLKWFYRPGSPQLTKGRP